MSSILATRNSAAKGLATSERTVSGDEKFSVVIFKCFIVYVL